jgi:hypothetical protein
MANLPLVVLTTMANLPPVVLTTMANLPRVLLTTSVVDTGGAPRPVNISVNFQTNSKWP